MQKPCPVPVLPAAALLPPSGSMWSQTSGPAGTSSGLLRPAWWIEYMPCQVSSSEWHIACFRVACSSWVNFGREGGGFGQPSV